MNSKLFLYPLLALLFLLKERFPFFWQLIEHLNSFVFALYYKKELIISLNKSLAYASTGDFLYKVLHKEDMSQLNVLLQTIESDQATFFEPHAFDLQSLEKQFSNKAFIMLGVFHNQKMIGYFFLRCGINKKCFVGRFIHPGYRKLGFGTKMNEVMYFSAWNAGFRTFATLSADNQLVMQSHQSNKHFVIRSKLPHNYMLVEFVKESALINVP